VWVVCFLAIIKGVRSSSWVVMVTATLPFVFLFILVGYYANLNKRVSGHGFSYMFQKETLRTVFDPSEVDASHLIVDAIN